VEYEVGFSVQSRSTDTIALDEENRPIRTDDGRLLFRPGGHGSLIRNLEELDGDVVHLSNIDNVVPDRLKPEITRWRGILIGYLCKLQRGAYEHAARLAEEPADRAIIDAAADFARDLDLKLPLNFVTSSDATRRKLLLGLLDRPMRVCGMVLNAGEPGGGPFWVMEPNGECTRQIVESAQIDLADPEQRRIFKSSTHFNPVDLVCGVRNWRGECFPLRKHIDPQAVFISNKSYQGRKLKALEHPGLWNGAMSDWITIFVEIPLSVFNPVKTVLDLLRPEHQPG